MDENEKKATTVASTMTVVDEAESARATLNELSLPDPTGIDLSALFGVPSGEQSEPA